MNFRMILGPNPPTVENYTKAVTTLYPEHAAEALKLYKADSDAAVEQVATDLAGDRFISYSTWRWGYLHSQNSGKPVYRYFYARPRPEMRPELGNVSAGLAGGVVREANPAPRPPAPKGAVHSAEIEYAMGNLPHNRVYDWQPEDYQVSVVMQGFFANFIKTGNPNGLGLPLWPVLSHTKTPELMYIDAETKAISDPYSERYLFLERINKK